VIATAREFSSSSRQVIDSNYFASCFMFSLEFESPRRILLFYQYCRPSAFILLPYGEMRNYG